MAGVIILAEGRTRIITLVRSIKGLKPRRSRSA